MTILAVHFTTYSVQKVYHFSYIFSRQALSLLLHSYFYFSYQLMQPSFIFMCLLSFLRSSEPRATSPMTFINGTHSTLPLLTLVRLCRLFEWLECSNFYVTFTGTFIHRFVQVSAIAVERIQTKKNMTANYTLTRQKGKLIITKWSFSRFSFPRQIRNEAGRRSVLEMFNRLRRH